MIFIDEEMLFWYYSILDSLDEYQKGTESTLSTDVEFLIDTSTDIRHMFTGKPSDKQQLVLDKAWEIYDDIVANSVRWVTVPATVVFKRLGYPGVGPAAGNIGTWTADGMKYVMKATGYDERIVREHMVRHHLD